MTKLINRNRSVRHICSTLIPVFAVLASFAALTSTGSAADNAERWTRAPRSPFVDVVEETCKSVVSIQGEKQYEPNRRSRSAADSQYDVFNGMGTGVIIDERGYVLTNYHVVKGLLKLEVITEDGERYRQVELVCNDPATDLALLKISPKKPLRKITMGRSENLRLVEEVYAIGNPFGYHCSVTRGIVSAIDRPLEVNDSLSYDSVIQTDAAINPGNSGGPLINIDGEMVGLNAAVREDAENIAFAIPIDVVVTVVERMLRRTVAKMTHHGLKFRVVDPDDPDYPQDGDGHDYIVVDSVDAKSPAAAAGVMPGDVLLSSNGYQTRSSLDFTCSLINMGLEDVATLKVERDGVEQEATVAFSNLARKQVRETAIADKAEKKTERYSNAKTENSFAESAEKEIPTLEEEEKENPIAFSAAETQTAAQIVWRRLGVKVETVSERKYREEFPNLQAVEIDSFNFAPNGGVRITGVASHCVFSSGDVKLQPGDLIFGFGVGKEKEDQLSVASLDNLCYIAQRLDEFASADDGKARVYLIRDETPYFLEIDLTQAK